jgi:hypothetical protein
MAAGGYKTIYMLWGTMEEVKRNSGAKKTFLKEN